jgi:hypothetical protein
MLRHIEPDDHLMTQRFDQMRERIEVRYILEPSRHESAREERARQEQQREEEWERPLHGLRRAATKSERHGDGTDSRGHDRAHDRQPHDGEQPTLDLETEEAGDPEEQPRLDECEGRGTG